MGSEDDSQGVISASSLMYLQPQHVEHPSATHGGCGGHSAGGRGPQGRLQSTWWPVARTLPPNRGDGDLPSAVL